MNFCTRFGRMIRKPKNEYTDRTYVKGSGFKGCDQYDRGYSSTSFVGTATGDNHYVEDDFLTNDNEDDLEIIDLSDEEPEAEFSDEESEAEMSDEEPEAEMSDEESEVELSDEEPDDESAEEPVHSMTKPQLVYTLNDEAGQNDAFLRMVFQLEYELSKQNDSDDDDEPPEFLESM